MPDHSQTFVWEFFAGQSRFKKLAEAEPGTFYLTDFLVENFERFVLGPLRIVERPELLTMFFGAYRRAVYLSQVRDEDLVRKARACAQQLQLKFEHLHCGTGELGERLRKVADTVSAS